MKKQKLISKLSASAQNVRFSEMQTALKLFGFALHRVSGSHHIYIRPGVSEHINIQNAHGKVKPCQIKQFLSIVERYDLEMEEKS